MTHIKSCSVGWGCRIHRMLLCETLVLELWGLPHFSAITQSSTLARSITT